MNELDQLAEKYGTDKSSRGHNYTDGYHREFCAQREVVSRVLEIGIWRGASLRMWRDYFPKALVVGVDSSPSTAIVDESRIVTLLGDSAKPETVDLVRPWGPFDIIVDDGSHQMVEQKANLELYFPHVRAGGVYVIEDLHTSYWRNYGGGGPDSMIELLKRLVDSVNFHGGREYATQRGAAEVPDWEPPESERDVVSISFYRSMCFLRKK